MDKLLEMIGIEALTIQELIDVIVTSPSLQKALGDKASIQKRCLEMRPLELLLLYVSVSQSLARSRAVKTPENVG